MNAVEDDVVKLVNKELESANKKFPMFRSAHEGCAVILEELEEARAEMVDTEAFYNLMWKTVKENSDFGSLLDVIQMKAESLACEAIQVAAMAKKFKESMDLWEANNE